MNRCDRFLLHKAVYESRNCSSEIYAEGMWFDFSAKLNTHYSNTEKRSAFYSGLLSLIYQNDRADYLKF